MIREAALLDDFKIDQEWLRNRISVFVDRHEVRKTLDALIDTKLIRFDSALKKYVSNPEPLVTEEEVRGDEIAKYYSSLYQLSVETTTNIPSKNFFWVYRRIKLNSAQFEKSRDRLIDFSKEILSRELEVTRKDIVLQVCGELMPISLS